MASPIALPRPPTRTESVLTWARQITDYVRSITPHPTDKVRPIMRREGTTFDITLLGASASAPPITYPWQMYASPWKGAGVDPDASTRIGRFRLTRGKCAGVTPSNTSAEFVCFGDLTDTDIEEADAVYTQVYLKVPTSENTVGDGALITGICTIKIVEGNDLINALGGVPDLGDDGSLPAYIVIPLGEVAWWGGAMHFQPGYFSYLDLAIVVSGTDCEKPGRDVVVIPVIPDL